MDISVEKSTGEITDKFFRLHGTEPAAVLKVVAALQHQNALGGFIPSLAKRDGYALWNKSVIEYPKNNTTYHRDSSSWEAETYVFTPIVQEDSNFVNGFFFSRIVGDSTELH